MGDGSLMMGSDRIGNRGPLVQLVTRASSAKAAERALVLVTDEMDSQLTRLQNEVGIPQAERVRTQVLSADGPYAVQGRPSRALVGTAALALLTLCAGARLLRRAPPWPFGRRPAARAHGLSRSVEVRGATSHVHGTRGTQDDLAVSQDVTEGRDPHLVDNATQGTTRGG
jgi:hypothetical protein